MSLIQASVVVVGGGEIGVPIYQLSRGGYEQVFIVDPRLSKPASPLYPVAALHVAMPGSLPDFVDVVAGYASRYDPEIVLVHSTTVPGYVDGIAARVGENRVVHAQVHGKHREGSMRRDMLRYPKFVATCSDEAFSKASRVLIAMGHAVEKIVRLSSPLAGEISKLLATTFFGYLIAWTQEIERLSDGCGVSF